MWTAEQFRDHLRGALAHLYDPHYLRSSPLASALGVAQRSDVALALQNILVEAVACLKPQAGVEPSSRAWRTYHVLLYRYVQQFTPDEVAEQLGLSVRHLRREQGMAVEALARRLLEQYRLLDEVCSKVAPQPDVVLPPGMPGVADELRWLAEASPYEAVDIEQALASALEVARPLARQCDARLDASVGAALPVPAVHPALLRQALLGLLSVAIRRTPGGLVSIQARAFPCEVELQVRAERPHPPISPLDDEADALQMVRRLADLCRGRLAVSADGGTFAASLIVPAREQATVLLVDDNVETVEFLQRYTLGTRYRLIGTSDPQQVEGLVARHSPQVIILDVMMPRVDGWALLGQIQQHPQTRHIPVVVCTVMPQEALALSLGARAFLRKPVTRQAFLTALDRVCAAPEPGPH